MSLNLYNSISKKLETFEPSDPNNVTVYLCGPTVYNYVHIGNARGPVVFDVLVNLLRKKFPKVSYARNITDVDDKINNAAKDAGVHISAITDKYTSIYREDMAALGVKAPDIEPFATKHIPEIIKMIEQLINNGNAYIVDGHVLFSVDSYQEYGHLSGRVDETKNISRLGTAEYKKNASDFVLWKPSSEDLPGWESPWGIGRPGWHIECSAMSAAHLGETIDIHGGGTDLQFPHHENEIAQSTCAHGGKKFSRFWVHNGMLNFDGGKMSKSVGNVSILNELLKKHPAEALRYALLSAHYRQTLDWSDDLIEQSVKTLDRIYGTVRDINEQLSKFNISVNLKSNINSDCDYSNDFAKEVERVIEDDLNTPKALSILNGYASDARKIIARINNGKSVDEKEDAENLLKLKCKIKYAGLMLGLIQQQPEMWFSKTVKNNNSGNNISSDDIDALIEKRNKAKLGKDFTVADQIRKQLSDAGIIIEDTVSGVRWKR